MRNLELIASQGIQWQLFATLTFRTERHCSRYGAKMFFALLRTEAKLARVHFKRVLWMLRVERGESLGRLHFHAVIGGLPLAAITSRNCLAMASRWESLHGGMARIKIYDSHRNGAAYIAKGLTAESLASLAGGNYEMAKFGFSSSLTLSLSSCRLIRSRLGLGNRHHGQVVGDRRAFRTEQGGVIASMYRSGQHFAETTQSASDLLLTGAYHPRRD